MAVAGECDQLQRVTGDLVELRSLESPLARKDLDEDGLVLCDSVDLDAGSSRQAQRLSRQLDAKLGGDTPGGSPAHRFSAPRNPFDAASPDRIGLSANGRHTRGGPSHSL